MPPFISEIMFLLYQVMMAIVEATGCTIGVGHCCTLRESSRGTQPRLQELLSADHNLSSTHCHGTSNLSWLDLGPYLCVWLVLVIGPYTVRTHCN
jgi:hypothetical protein